MRRIALAAVAVAGTWTAPARASDKQQCVAASEQGQQLRDDGKYQRAREAFASCARPICPPIVQSDCVKWLADLEANSPTVVIVAKDEKGRDLSAVTVTVDGAPLATALDGRPVMIDPGEHHFHYETKGFPPVDDRVLIHASDKSRPLTAQFHALPAPPAPPSPSGATAGGGGDARVSVQSGSTWHTLGWIALGVGAASLAGAGASLAIRQSAISDARSICQGPNFTHCPANDASLQSDVSRGQTASTLVTVFGILGAVAVTGGITLLVMGDGHSQQSRVIITPTLGGAAAAWRF
jgi:hypothetical protein